MNIAAEIISGTSIAGIHLGDDITAVLLKLYEENRNINEIKFRNREVSITHYEIDSEIVTLSVNDNLEKIGAIWCKAPYRGKYKGVLSPGMRVEDILTCTSKQSISNGFLIIDGDYNAGFILPNTIEYDDIDDVKELPLDLVLDELHIMTKGWCGMSEFENKQSRAKQQKRK